MSFKRIWAQGISPAGIPAEIDFEKITMPEVLTRTAKKFPPKRLLIFMGTEITYQELESLVNRFAKALLSLGVKKGARWPWFFPNISQIANIVDFAVFRIGAVTVMNNPKNSQTELSYQLNDSNSAFLVTLDVMFPVAKKMARKDAGKKSDPLFFERFILPAPLKPASPAGTTSYRKRGCTVSWICSMPKAKHRCAMCRR